MSNKQRQSLWKGPEEDGITLSLLSRFLVCPERFRLYAIEGLSEGEDFDHKIEYGTLWHSAEEAIAHEHRNTLKTAHAAIVKAAADLKTKYPNDYEEIDKWTALCCSQFTVYLKHYAVTKEPARTFHLRERTFAVPFTLPSNRIVTLRGKLDGVFTATPRFKGKSGTTYILEHKTKGTIDDEGITKTLHDNLQTMIYYIAYRELCQELDTPPPQGICYNVIRRPLSDKFAPRQKKAETEKEFYARVGTLMLEDPAHHFLRRWCLLKQEKIDTFINECLIPLLERLCDWWEWIAIDPFHPFRTGENGIPGAGIHYRFPFGVYNSLSSGFRGDYFKYMTTGDKRSLTKVSTLYPELAV
jgi:hypothetical protein